MSACQGCGGDLLPNRNPGNPRKWCSERCRKSQYAGACVDCGAPTNGSDGRGPNASLRCGECNARRFGEQAVERHLPQRQLVERLWAEGKTSREIGEVVGWDPKYGKNLVAIYRSRGYDLPYRRTPEQLARMAVGADERMAKARAVATAKRKAAA